MNAFAEFFTPEAGQRRTAWLDDLLSTYVTDPANYYFGPTGVPQKMNAILQLPEYTDAGDMKFAAEASRDLWHDPSLTNAINYTTAGAALAIPFVGAKMASEGVNVFGDAVASGVDDMRRFAADESGALFPNKSAEDAWILGQRHRAKYGDNLPYDDLSNKELEAIASLDDGDPVARAFYRSGWQGASAPLKTSGWRYGDAPARGFSVNHVEGTGELGVSMASVRGNDFEWFPMGGRVGSDKIEYDGWLLDPDHFYGSDGEPLMVGLAPPQPRSISNPGGKPHYSLRAYHGSPHDFDRFSTDNIGTGEGAQAYGHGLYFAEEPDVALQYRDSLATHTIDDVKPDAEAIAKHQPEWDSVLAEMRAATDGLPPSQEYSARQPFYDRLDAINEKMVAETAERTPQNYGGSLFEVGIDAEPGDFLDWDAPLSGQPKAQALFDKAIKERGGSERYWLDRLTENPDGGKALRELGTGGGAIENRLNDAGIPGIRYKDGFSRGTDEGTSNYVLFDDSLATILAKNGERTPQGAAQDVLDLIGAGRASEVTDEMMAAADDYYLFNHYDLPMDEASRMGRARDMGFDFDGYHGGAEDFSAFDPSKTGTVQNSDWGDGVYVSPSKSSAEYYAGEAASRTNDTIGDNLYDEYEQLTKQYGTRPMYETIHLGRKTNDPIAQAQYAEITSALDKWRAHKKDFRASNGGNIYPLSVKTGDAMYYQYEGITDPYLGDMAKSKGRDSVFVHHKPDDGETLQNSIEEALVFDPTNIRSRFARFDPRLKHLANLSAAGAGVAVGLDSLSEDDELGDYMRSMGLLQ